jgi:hypothetical protein
MTHPFSTNGVVSANSPEPATAAPPINRVMDHDAHGRFAPGNRGGPSNPFARHAAALRQAFFDAITEEDMRAIAAELAAMARLGELPAIKLLLTYVLGKPAPPADPDTLDVQEWQRWREKTNIRAKEAASICNGIPAEMACTIARAAVPVVQKAEAAQLQASLRAGLDVPAEARASEEAEDAPAPPADRHQTAETASCHRQQTAETALSHRQQTAETAEEFRFSEAEVAQAASWLIAACHGHRQQTEQTANGKEVADARGPEPAG